MSHRAKSATALWVLIFELSVATICFAGTWFVEKDGSGHSSTIQGAIELAAPGDTIQIGPGRFDDPQVVTCPGWTHEVQVLVDKDNLTIIGCGSETIIGQEEWWDESQGQHMGIVASDGWGCYRLTVQNLRIENAGGAVYSSHEDSGNNELRFIDCEIHGSRDSLFLYGDGGRVLIDGCILTKTMGSGTHLGAWGQSELVITNTVFSQWDQTPSSQNHAKLWGVQHAEVRGCEFLEGDGGLDAIFSARVDIANCVFDGQSNYGLHPSIDTSMYADSCQLLNQNIAVAVSEVSSLTHVSNCLFDGVGYCAVGVSYSGPLTIVNCDLDGGDHGVVNVIDALCDDIGTLNMVNNYWGTTDPDSIASLINDYNDNEDACFEVLFEPFLSESTPVETMGLSDIKSLFR